VYLLDTDVVSELRKPRPHGGVLAWIEGVAESDLHLSAVTIGEIQAGIEITRAQDAAKAAEIEAWLDQVAASFNVLSLDAETLRIWARLMHGTSAALIEDALIAATALRHDLTLATRNTKDFVGFGVRLVDPFRTERN